MLSFVPPDGNFRLMSYHIGAQNIVSVPLYVRHSIVFKDQSGGKLELQLGSKQTMGKPVRTSHSSVGSSLRYTYSSLARISCA